MRGGILKDTLKIFKEKRGFATVLLLACIVFVGLYYRVLFAYNVHFAGLHLGTQFGHDEYNYINMAVNIVEKGVYGYMTDGTPNAYVTPGYPLFLALIYSIFGSGEKTVLYVKLIQAVISVLSVVLVFFVGNKIGGRFVGLVAAAFCAFYPPFVLYSRHLLTETLYIFMFLLYFITLLYSLDSGKKRLHFLSGVLFAAAVLVRPLILILMPLPYIYKLLTSKKDARAVISRFGVHLLGFVLLMLPWWIRNIVTLDSFIFLCTQSNPFYYGIIRDYATLPPSENETIDGIRLIFQNLINNPVTTIKWFTLDKLNIIFGKQDYWLQGEIGYMQSADLLHYFIISFGAAGMAMSRYIKELRLIGAFIFFNTLFLLLFIPVERYAVPLMPLISVCGAYMLWYLFSKCRAENNAKG